MFIVYDKTGLCHYWGSIFRALWFVSYSACFMTHVQCLSLSQVESEGFPLAGWGNDDRVPIVSSINFVISHTSFFIPRWKSPLWTQFSLDWSILSLLQGILLVLINIFCAHSRFFCLSRPQLTTVKALKVSADLMRARLFWSHPPCPWEPSFTINQPQRARPFRWVSTLQLTGGISRRSDLRPFARIEASIVQFRCISPVWKLLPELCKYQLVLNPFLPDRKLQHSIWNLNLW